MGFRITKSLFWVITGILVVTFVSPGIVMPAGNAEGEERSAIWVKRIHICRAVKEREPMDKGESFPKDIGQLYCFTDVRDANEETFVTHNWYHGNEFKASVKLKVAGDHWRTWSSKRIDPSWTGDWTVVIKDAAGRKIASIDFTVGVQEKGEDSESES